MRSKFSMAWAVVLAIAGCNTDAPASRAQAVPERAGSTQELPQPTQGAGNPPQRDASDVAAASASYYGSEYGIRASYEACMRQQPDDVSTAGHRQDCADAEQPFQDERLDRIYQKALNALEADGAEAARKATALAEAQRRWRSGLDAACVAEARQAGSTMGPAAQSTCYMDATAKRAQQLEQEHRGSIE